MKSSNSLHNQPPFIPNKKLVLHFDVENVLRINAKSKDLYVYELCSNWVWGRLQRNSKEDPDKVTGWKIASNSLSTEHPDAGEGQKLYSYKEYLEDFVKPSEEEYEKLILSMSKGPASKAKAQIEKNIKNITLPKTLFETLKETNEDQNQQLKELLTRYNESNGKYEILPAFYKFVMFLKKSKREFAIIIKNNNLKDDHPQIIAELNLFFTGLHPLFNGKNGTPLVKFDGTMKGGRNLVIESSHQAVLYEFGEREYFESFGTMNYQEEKDTELFRESFKSLKTVKLCSGPGEIYSHSHAILLQSACIYQMNPQRTIFIDPVDYLTHEIYFTSSAEARVESNLGTEIESKETSIVSVHLFDYLKDVDFFSKALEYIEKKRAEEIEKIEKGENVPEGQQQEGEKLENTEQNRPAASQQSDSDYLKRTILPVLEGAINQATLLRPKDPLAFIALQCLKNKDRVKLAK